MAPEQVPVVFRIILKQMKCGDVKFWGQDSLNVELDLCNIVGGDLGAWFLIYFQQTLNFLK